MVANKFNNEVLCGFFDADGSFVARVYYLTKKPLGMSMKIGFSQKDAYVLKAVFKTLGVPATAAINKRKHLLPSGKTSTSNSKEFAFSKSASKLMLSVWEKTPPNAPTKYLDYKICLILDEAQKYQKNEITVINRLLPNETVDLRVACLSLLYLRFQMFGKVKPNRNPNLIPIEDYYQGVNATQVEIDESRRIGQLLFDIVQQDLTQHVISVTPAYLLGYHVGDGCFSIGASFNAETNTQFRGNFIWKLTDCKENKPLLEVIKQFLENNGIVFGPCCWKDSGTYVDLELTTLPAIKQLVNLFEQWSARNVFPKVRLNQFECFAEAYSLYNDPNFRDDLAMCQRFIDLKWKINPGTNSKKKGSHAEDTILLQNWFNNKAKS